MALKFLINYYEKTKIHITFCRFFFKATGTQAQALITDNLQYLQDSIVANKSYYIGKPLDSLLKDLKIPVVQAWDGMIPLTGAPDTLLSNGILLYFDDKEFSPEMFMKRSQRTGPNPVNFNIKRLQITFLNPVPVQKSRLTIQDLLDWWWTPQRKTFWGPKIIGDLHVYDD